MPSVSFFISGACVNPDPPATATGFIDGGSAEITDQTAAEITGGCDASLTQGAIPLASSFQECAIEAFVGGRPVPLDQLVGKIEVDTQVERLLNTWTFTTAVTAPDGVFGNPLDRVGPPTGLLDVDLYATYRVNGQVVRYPLMLHGVATLSKRIAELSAGTKVGWTEQLEGLDRGGRFDGMPGTLVIPEGSMLPREQVAERLIGSAKDASSPPDLEFHFEASQTKVKKYVPLVDGDPWQLSQEMFATEGRRLLRDVEGFNWNPRLGLQKNGAAVPVFMIDERLILCLQTFEMDGPPGKVPTSVTLTGTEQLVSPPTVAPAYKVVTSQQIEYAVYQPKAAEYIQNLSGCTLSFLGISINDPRLIPVKLVVTTLEYLGGTLVTQAVETYAYVWPEAARYKWDETTHALVCQQNVFLPPGAAPGPTDQTGAYATRGEEWLLQSRVRTQKFYDAIGYTGQDGLPTDPWFQAFHGTAGGSFAGTGFYLGSIATTEEWYTRRHAWKQESGTTPWQSIDPLDGVLVRGSGEAVEDAQALFTVTKQVVEVQHADASGTLQSIATFNYGFGLYQGGEFQFQANNGQTSSQELETFELVGGTDTVYIPLSETSGYQEIQSAYTFDGSSNTVGDPKVSIGPGIPPAIEQLPNLQPDLNAFPGAQMADPNQTQPIKVEVKVPALLATHPPYKIKTSLPWAETMQELGDAGLYLIEQAAAAKCTFTTPLLGMLQAGYWVILIERPFGINALGQITAVKHWSNGTLADPYLSTFTVSIYPVIGSVEVPETGTTPP